MPTKRQQMQTLSDRIAELRVEYAKLGKEIDEIQAAFRKDKQAAASIPAYAQKPAERASTKQRLRKQHRLTRTKARQLAGRRSGITRQIKTLEKRYKALEWDL